MGDFADKKGLACPKRFNNGNSDFARKRHLPLVRTETRCRTADSSGANQRVEKQNPVHGLCKPGAIMSRPTQAFTPVAAKHRDPVVPLKEAPTATGWWVVRLVGAYRPTMVEYRSAARINDDFRIGVAFYPWTPIRPFGSADR